MLIHSNVKFFISLGDTSADVSLHPLYHYTIHGWYKEVDVSIQILGY